MAPLSIAALRGAPVSPRSRRKPWGASWSVLIVRPGGAPGRDPLSRCTGVADQPPDLLRLGEGDPPLRSDLLRTRPDDVGRWLPERYQRNQEGGTVTRLGGRARPFFQVLIARPVFHDHITPSLSVRPARRPDHPHEVAPAKLLPGVGLIWRRPG